MAPISVFMQEPKTLVFFGVGGLWGFSFFGYFGGRGLEMILVL